MICKQGLLKLERVPFSTNDRGTDRRNRFQNVLSKTFEMIQDTPTKAEN